MNIAIVPDLTLQPLDAEQLARIETAAGDGSIVKQVGSLHDQPELTASMEILFGQITPEQFVVARSLRWLHLSSSGVDHLMFPEFQQSEIVLTSEKGLVGPHLADHAMGLLLALARRIGTAIRDGATSWDKRVEYRMSELELEGLHLCIVGFGGTGRSIAKRAAGFDMQISAFDLYPAQGSAQVSNVEPMERLPTALQYADVVAVCLPLTERTQEMFNDALFAQMKMGAILINVTRGEVIDHQAMLRALESGRLGGAGLDVHYKEPLPADDPLWDNPNVVMTPHTAGASQLRTGRNYERFVDNLRRRRVGEPLVGVVDKQLGF